MKQAARKARTQSQGEKALAQAVPGASVRWREREDGLAATVVLPEGAPGEAHAAAEAALKAAGAAEVLVVGTGTAQEAPSRPASARGGHADPLSLGNTAPRRMREQKPEKRRPEGVRRVVAVASGKGGVGKSTVASRLALALGAKGYRTGLLDLDIYGPSLPMLFDVHEKPAVAESRMQPIERCGLALNSIGFLVSDEQALAWRGPMVMGAARQLIEETDWGELDWLIVDTPPGTGDAHLTMIQRLVIDAALLVTTPSPLAMADVRRGRQLFEKMNVPVLGLIENMAQTPDGQTPFGPGLGEAELAALGLGRLARLPLEAALGALPAEGGALGEAHLQPVVEALEKAAGSLDRAPSAQ